MTQPGFREACENDLQTLVRMLADDALGATREDVSMPLNQRYIDAFENIERDPNNELIVAVVDDETAGMMQLTFIPYLTHTGSWRCLIEGVRVAQRYRGDGLGHAMIEYAITRARERHCRIIQLTSDKQRPDALRFYTALGFEATHEGFKMKLVSTSADAGG